MYLTAKKYINSWEHNGEEKAAVFKKVLESVGVALGDLDEGSPSGYVEFHIGYWRKANQIHSWFVQNVQGGKDECIPHYVSREKLNKLRNVCMEALTNRDKVEEILAPTEGFFFGSQDIDEWYFQDLEKTVKIIDKCLSERYQDWTFEYRSSW